LPFPGIPLLYSVADPDDLGEHRYRSYLPLFDKERDRGVIYTTRGGFVDISHIRGTGDLTRLATLKLRAALREGQNSVSFDAADRTRVHFEIDYPPGWYVLSPERREALCFELALVEAQRLCYGLGTWHEAITWLGFQTVPLISEKHSAFTYDDVVAHLLGVRAAGFALRNDHLGYNRAMTLAIDTELSRAGAVSAGTTRKALRAVKGSWWRWGKALKRHLDTALVNGYVTPMLVPGFGESLPTLPASEDPFLRLPTLAAVDTAPIEARNMFTVRLEPQFGQWEKMRRLLPGQPRLVDPEVHLPILVEVVRYQMRAEIGPEVDRLTPPIGAGNLVALRRSDIVRNIPGVADEINPVVQR
jgi:hypothetical protein